MNPSIRTLLLLIVISILAACGATGASDASSTPAPTQPADESVTPDGSAAPSENPGTPVPAGTLTVADGIVVDGPGAPLSEALTADLSEPVFVRGVLFLDEDGNVWLADSITDASVPTFSDVRVGVANFPNIGPTWDMGDAAITGLQEVNGIRFYDEMKLYGTITP